MLENSKAQTLIEELCQKLRCSELAEDLGRVNRARELLTQLQQDETLRKLHSNSKYKNNTSKYDALKISELLLETKQRLYTAPLDPNSSDKVASERSVLTQEESNFSEEECEIESSMEGEDLLHDSWLGFFRGYNILQKNQEPTLNPRKQCIELSLNDDCCSLESYLREGIRCFIIDLFSGTDLEKQKLIFHLRESELKISKEYGFPFHATLLALLSPRLQYTGVMAAGNAIVKLEKRNNIILTTKRKYSVYCNSSKLYVNARFLLEDCKKGDFILVGPEIQLMITDVLKDELKCVVKEAGLLSSRLPVRFPARCHRSQVSLEELEDITFAREVGINVLVSYKPGSRQYLQELQDTFDLLKYDNLKLFTRLVLNEDEYQDIEDVEWIAKCYEGFLVDGNFQDYNNCCHLEDAGYFQNILELTSTCRYLMEKLFIQGKPIILNPSLIAGRQWFVKPHNIPHIFQFPDKFLFSKESFKNSFSFFLLHNALTEDIANRESPIETFCDLPDAGDDILARASVAASSQSHIKAIVVCSAWPHTAIKLSHFRPEVPVILVSATKSFCDYISLYHHLIFLHFQSRGESKYVEYVANAFMFSLIYLQSKNILCDGQSVLLLYATNSETHFCDNHLIFRFNENNFASNLQDILFP